jgi:hypothetical protein
VSQYLRSGFPIHLNGTTGVAAVQEWQIRGGGASTWIEIVNTDAVNSLEVFFPREANSPAPVAGDGMLIYPGKSLGLPAEINKFYTYSTAAVSFRAVFCCRS